MTPIAWVLFAIVVILAALQCYTSTLASRTIRNLEARLGALSLARTPGEYVGLMNTPTGNGGISGRRPEKVKVRRGKADDDREKAPSLPIGMGGEW